MPLSYNLKQEIATANSDPRRLLFAGTPQMEDESLLLEIGGDLQRLDQVERDGHIAGILDKRRLNVTRHEWEVKPASEDAKDQMAADIVRENFLKLNLDEATEHLLDAIWKGFSGVEALWEVDDKLDRMVVSELRPRPQDRLIFKLPDGTPDKRFIHHLGYQLRISTVQSPYDGIPAPARKFLIHSRGSKIGNPYGRPLLGAVLWWLSTFKREVIKFWLIHLDKFSSPTPKGTYPMGNSELKKQVEEAMYSIGNSGYAVVPQGVDLSLLDTAARTGDPFEKFIEWANREASKAILGETLSTQEGQSGGSRAATEAHTESSSVHLAKRDADLLSPVFNELAGWITELNVPGANPPTFWRLFPELEAKANLNQVAARDKTIVELSGRKLSEQYLLSTYGVEFEQEEDPDQGDDSETSNMSSAPLIGVLGIGGSQAMMNFLGQYQSLGMSQDNALSVLGGVFGVKRAQGLTMLPANAPTAKTRPDQEQEAIEEEPSFSAANVGWWEPIAPTLSEVDYGEVFGVWFAGRRTPVLVRAESRSEAIAKAQKKKKRGGSVKTCRLLTADEKKASAGGKWLRTGAKGEPAGYNPGMRGSGPPPGGY